MGNFKKEYIKIGKRELMMLVDENDVKWYPLNSFFKKVLFKTYNIGNYRDTTFIKYMQVVEVSYRERKDNKTIRTWFVNEEGIKLIIKNMSMSKSNTTKAEIQNEMLNDACKYFNIKRNDDIKPRYTNIMLNLKGYNEWEEICLTRDYDIEPNTTWKKCDKCDKYFPNNPRYFDKMKDRHGKDRLRRNCRKCNGKQFASNDNKIQSDFEAGGIDLVKCLLNKNYTKALKIIIQNKINYTPIEFYEKETLIKLINYIRNNIMEDKNDYNLKYMSQFIKISPIKMKNIIDGDIKIGCLATKKRKMKARKKIMTKTKLIKECNRIFKQTIPASKIKIDGINPIVGIITNKGLCVICEHPKKIKYAKLYQFTNDVSQTNMILRIIDKEA